MPLTNTDLFSITRVLLFQEYYMEWDGLYPLEAVFSQWERPVTGCTNSSLLPAPVSCAL